MESDCRKIFGAIPKAEYFRRRRRRGVLHSSVSCCVQSFRRIRRVGEWGCPPYRRSFHFSRNLFYRRPAWSRLPCKPIPRGRGVSQGLSTGFSAYSWRGKVRGDFRHSGIHGIPCEKLPLS